MKKAPVGGQGLREFGGGSWNRTGDPKFSEESLLYGTCLFPLLFFFL